MDDLRMEPNSLYFGDNLEVLRQFPPDSVDLIYLDPPFNSNRDYNAIFKDETGAAPSAQIKAFSDTWKWHMAVDAYQEMVERGGRVSRLLGAMHELLGPNDVMAYLSMMALRLSELHRVLKPTGSIFLHCDPTASHYLKLLLDAQFSKLSYRNEIIWHYRKWPSGRAQFQRNHDAIFFYSKTGSKDRFFEAHTMERAASTTKRFGTKRIISGYDEEGRRIPSQMSEEDSPGVWGDDVWDIGRVPPIKQRYQTQKPEPLLKRIITSASREGDLILDPFAGCGTAIVEAHRAKRKWIGIDVTYWAIDTIIRYMTDEFGPMDIPVYGRPATVDEARHLAETNPGQFEQWAVSLVRATPTGGKPIDGEIIFVDDETMTAKKCAVEITGGQSSKKHFDAFLNHARNADMGIYVTLNRPSRGMIGAAKETGYYYSEQWDVKYPKVQLITIRELLEGKQPLLPPPYRRKGRGVILPLSNQIHPLKPKRRRST
jgi:site-specific DNA-methyltransferase (adenine-specific)